MKNMRTGHFVVGTNEPGTQRFAFALLVNDNRLVGQGTVTRATFDMPTHLTGTAAMIVQGGDTTLTLQLEGHEFATPMPPNPLNVEATILLDSGANGGSGSYRYRQCGSPERPGPWQQVTDVPVTVRWDGPAA